MAKEVTLVQRAEMLTAGIRNRASNIERYLRTLEQLESKLKLDANTLALFRLSVRSIRADVNSIANDEERERA